MIIICDISALEYWRTPPIVRDAALSQEDALRVSEYSAPFSTVRRRARPRTIEDRLLERLPADLKNLSLPVHIMVDSATCRRTSPFVKLHRMPANLPNDQLVDLGNDLWVLSPALMLLFGFSGWNTPSMALAMYECCGTYARFDPNPLARITCTQLKDSGLISPHMGDPRLDIREFYDATGRRVPFIDEDGDAYPWQAAYNPKTGEISMWRRPPLTSHEELQTLDDRLGRVWGASKARAAVPMVFDGSASSLESRAWALLLSPSAFGGEEWDQPMLNHRIDLDATSQIVAGTTYCIADGLWKDRRSILEINGESYHTDSFGFITASGRTPALENMGYRVAEISFEQLSDLDQLDVMLPYLSERLGRPLQERTAAWLKRRNRLHSALFACKDA